MSRKTSRAPQRKTFLIEGHEIPISTPCCRACGLPAADAGFPVQCKCPRVFVPPPADKRYERLMGAFSELQAAAQKVVDETDRIHDNSPWPQKYRAPYGAIVELRKLLAKQYGLRG